MAYSDISIVAPDSARVGESVSVEVRVKNLQGYTIYVIPVLDVNGGRAEGSYETLVPGQTRSWYFGFAMPSRSVTVKAESWCESYYFDWHLDDTAQKAISLGFAFVGSISRMELEYDEARASIPAYNIPQGKRGLVHIWGRNDTDVNQKLGIYWVIREPNGFPEGVIVEEYYDWQAFSTGPGQEHEFIGGRFNLDKVGTYDIRCGLLMNPDAPVYVDIYYGDLCTVKAELVPTFSDFGIKSYSSI